MASIKYSGLVSEIKGKIAGTSFQKGLGGYQVKSKGHGSVAGAAIGGDIANKKRAVFTTVSQKWRGIDPTIRTAWNAAAASFPATNRFGDIYTPSGYQLWMQFNYMYWQMHDTFETATPAVPTWPTGVVSGVTIASATYAEFSLSVEPTASFRVEVLCSGANSAGTVAPVGGYKFCGIQVAVSSVFIQFRTQLVNRLGNPLTGSTIFVKWRYIETASGIAGPWFSFSHVVT